MGRLAPILTALALAAFAARGETPVPTTHPVPPGYAEAPRVPASACSDDAQARRWAQLWHEQGQGLSYRQPDATPLMAWYGKQFEDRGLWKGRDRRDFEDETYWDPELLAIRTRAARRQYAMFTLQSDFDYAFDQKDMAEACPAARKLFEGAHEDGPDERAFWLRTDRLYRIEARRVGLTLE